MMQPLTVPGTFQMWKTEQLNGAIKSTDDLITDAEIWSGKNVNPVDT